MDATFMRAAACGVTREAQGSKVETGRTKFSPTHAADDTTRPAAFLF
jgi:hypothetical protein